jgi:para-aminobenzoate synthetase component I
VPQAVAEARSWSLVRMEEGGVTSCWKRRAWYGPGTIVSMLLPTPLQMLTPAEMAVALSQRDGFVWMDSALPGPGAVSILTAEPVEVLRGHIERDWKRVRAALSVPRAAAGGLYGWVGYDGAFVLGVYPHGLRYEHDSSVWSRFGDFKVQLSAFRPPPPPPLCFKPLVTKEQYISMVEAAQAYIAAGDIYQVNLSYPWSAAWPQRADALALYLKLREISPAPHAAFLKLDGTTVLSASMETFLRLDGSQITTRPIKGTRPRFVQDALRDETSQRELQASEKERAELLMITDLERNDLGQVCEFGSVQVPELWRVESFAQVFHLVSTVTGKLRAHIDHAGAFRSCFPGGSITGAPKKRATEIITELETHPRGLYTGAIGWFGFDGQSQWNIAIRTAVQRGDDITFHVGSGIVADSVPELEWEETLHKASGILSAWA